ncbi:MAG: hypothetical protein JXR40_04495 [Pontiellaceae bacterium]|nr:hypothetical protein [Pontiellaceae bacterium]
MKKIVILGLGVVLAVAGCATKSGFVGAWRCNPLPEGLREDDMQAMSLYITEQGSAVFVGETDEGTTSMGSIASWHTNSNAMILFEGESLPDDLRGTLIADDMLFVTTDDDGLKFERQE